MKKIDLDAYHYVCEEHLVDGFVVLHNKLNYSHCPVCNPNNSLQKEYDDLVSDYESLENDNSENYEENRKLNSEIVKLKKEIEMLKKEKEEVQLLLEFEQNEVAMLTNKLSKLDIDMGD
jgi:DNA repair exonuclease SbcCD ATPase subunit